MLADPVRLRLLSLLVCGAGRRGVTALMEPLERSQPSVPHHPKMLADAGLVACDNRGR